MGNSQTTRKVSFEREQTGLIAISDSVAKRLRDAEGSKGSSQPEKGVEQTTNYKLAGREPALGSSSTSSKQSVAHHPDGSHTTQYNPKPSQAQQDEHNKALARLEEQWQERYKRLEGDNVRIKQTSTEEFNRAVKHVEDLFATKGYTVGSADLQKAVMDCYRENITRSLKCSREADAFIRSIEEYKLGFLSKQVI